MKRSERVLVDIGIDELRGIRHWVFCSEGQDDVVDLLKRVQKDVFDYQRHTSGMMIFLVDDVFPVGQIFSNSYFIHPTVLPDEIESPFLIDDQFVEVCLDGKIDNLSRCDDPNQLHGWYWNNGVKYVGVFHDSSVKEETDQVPVPDTGGEHSVPPGGSDELSENASGSDTA